MKNGGAVTKKKPNKHSLGIHGKHQSGRTRERRPGGKHEAKKGLTGKRSRECTERSAVCNIEGGAYRDR